MGGLFAVHAEVFEGETPPETLRHVRDARLSQRERDKGLHCHQSSWRRETARRVGQFRQLLLFLIAFMLYKQPGYRLSLQLSRAIYNFGR